MGAFLGLDWTAAARQFFTDPVGCVSEPDYIVQEKGKLSADGERGGVWGVNVLSTYILVSSSAFLSVSRLILTDLRSPKSFIPTSRNPRRASLSIPESSTSLQRARTHASSPPTQSPIRNYSTPSNRTTRVNTSQSS